MRPIEQACYWFSTIDGLADMGARLQAKQPSGCDIAIVGAGFTGLWTAHFLQKLDPSKRIVVLEQGIAGYGASGRNAGIVSPCLDHSHALAISHFGADEAARMAHIGLDNIKELAAYASDCDFQPSGMLYVALTPKHVDAFQEDIDVAKQLGITGNRLLNAEQTQAEIHSPLYLGGLEVGGGGIINPLKLIYKLKAEFERNGGCILERTRVEAVRQNEVQTAGGTLKADRVILATDAYTHHLFPGLLTRFIPLYDYIMVTRPLTSEEMDKIGWTNRQGVTDGRTFFNYYRLTADNRILWGTSEAVYYSDNRVDPSCDHSEHHYRTLKESFKRHFPQLPNMEFPFAWGGPIASTTRLTPFFGSLHGGKTVYALGYTGHGIGTTRVAGKILAHMALSKTSDLLQLKMACEQPFPYPPEPIRRIAVNMVTRSLQQVDAGHKPNLLLQMLDRMHIGFSS